MKSLYALYDRKDCFIDCDFSLKKSQRKKRFYRSTKKTKSNKNLQNIA